MSGPVILPYRGITPKIDPKAFVAPGAVIIGDVEIGPESSIWFGCVLRGDVNYIRIGSRTNIQDGTVIHTASGLQSARLGKEGSSMPAEGYPTLVGDNVTVGHMTLLHACTIESDAFVGMHSSVMDGAKIESGGMLAAGALLTAGKIISKGQLWAGSPAKFWRDLSSDDIKMFGVRAGQYAELGGEYLKLAKAQA
ncbi:MAG: gamma carbonic anhydrase family protein [Alphaproteobacteria bacterium]